MDDLRIYQSRLPHWRLDGACYFVGWRVKSGDAVLSPQERTLVRDALLHFDRQRYELFAWVVMDDHTHALMQMLSNYELEDVLQSWKSFTAKKLQRQFGRNGAVWQKDTFNRIVRNEQEFLEKQRYIMNNPYKRWPDLFSYEWVWPVDD